jgi:putative transposase
MPFREAGRLYRRFWVAQRFTAAIGWKHWKALAAEVSMAAPRRGNTGYSSYFITASTYQRRLIFQSDLLARLFVEVMLHYRQENKYLLHEFVVMRDHFHLLLTPTLTLERALQLIKGGFSFRAKRENGFAGEIWQKSFYDRRIRDLAEFENFRDYIHQNPVKGRLVETAKDYPFSSAAGYSLDEVPQRLKPIILIA